MQDRADHSAREPLPAPSPPPPDAQRLAAEDQSPPAGPPEEPATAPPVDSNPDEPPTLFCPECGQPIPDPAPGAAPAFEPFMHCPRCNQDFIRPVEEESSDEQARSELEARHESEEKTRQHALDSARIEMLSQSRRNAIRSRSYLILGIIGCFCVACDLVIEAVTRLRQYHRVDLRICGYLLFAGAAAMATIYFARRTIAFSREINMQNAPPPEPPTPPDFSTLSDGSQQWKNLDDVQ